MLYEIKHRWSGAVLFSAEAGSFKLAFHMAIQAKVDLSGSDLSDCDLRGSDLSGCDLSGSDLSGCDLRGSNLSDCDLSGCDLRGSDLSGSDLSGCDLRGSNLSDCDLRGSDLRGSDLSGCDLTPVRDDFWAVLSSAPKEAEGLRQALIDGRVDGSTYSGECACLVGTIANLCGKKYSDVANLRPDSSRPAERFFLGIREGDTPSTNQISALVVKWLDIWLANMRGAFGCSNSGDGA